MKLSLILTALILSTSVVFGDNTPDRPDGKEMEGTIKKQLNIPLKVFRSGKESAVVDFKMNASGQPEVLRIHSSNRELNSYIREEFKKMKFDSSTYSPEKTYSVKVNFRIL